MSARLSSIRGATISGTGMYVPDRVLTNADFERMVETSDEWIRERTGIIERRIISEDQASSDMAVAAALKALDMAKMKPEDLDQIIVATTSPDRYLPSCACTVQAKIGAKNAAGYDVFAACTGFVYGMGLVRGVIGTGLAENVLLIGVETLSRVVDYTDRNPCVLLGDGAGAAVFTPCQPEDGILGVSIHSDGVLGDLLEIPAGGSAMPASHATVAARGHFIKMRGKELFKVAVRGMEESLRHALDMAGLTTTDLDIVIPHQTTGRTSDALCQRLSVTEDKVMIKIER